MMENSWAENFKENSTKVCIGREAQNERFQIKFASHFNSGFIAAEFLEGKAQLLSFIFAQIFDFKIYVRNPVAHLMPRGKVSLSFSLQPLSLPLDYVFELFNNIRVNILWASRL